MVGETWSKLGKFAFTATDRASLVKKKKKVSTVHSNQGRKKAH